MHPWRHRASLPATITTLPFWFFWRSDRFGSVPLPGASASIFSGGIKGYFLRRPVSWIGVASLLLRADVGSSSRVTLIEGLCPGHVQHIPVPRRAPASGEFTGLVDFDLVIECICHLRTMPWVIPKVQLAIPEYFSIPGIWQIIRFQGQFRLWVVWREDDTRVSAYRTPLTLSLVQYVIHCFTTHA